jgi:hypothetical protein
MQVVSKNSTQNALDAMKVARYDIVITNVWRPVLGDAIGLVVQSTPTRPDKPIAP